MPQPLPARQRSRSLAAERSILKATLAILSKGGYAALTIDRVAATARASKTTIYRRWQTKEHLILAVLDQLPLAAPPRKASFEADLAAMFRQFTRNMQDSPLRGVMPMLVAECVHNPALSSALIKVNHQRRAPLREIIARAIGRGELAADTDVELAIDVIQGAIAMRSYFLLERLTDAWVRKLIRLIRHGTGRR